MPAGLGRERSDELEGGGDRHGRAPDMRHHAHTMQAREVRYAPRFREAAHATHVGLRYVYCSRLYRLPEGPAAVPSLASGHWDGLARAHGARLVVSTDSHARGALALRRWGATVARRAWLTPGDILNTLPYDEFRRTLRRNRSRAA